MEDEFHIPNIYQSKKVMILIKQMQTKACGWGGSLEMDHPYIHNAKQSFGSS